MSDASAPSPLDALMAPEIENDEFYAAIEHIAANEDIRTVLDLGSSSGQGSTEALVIGLRQRTTPATLYCLEVSRVRYMALAARYAADGFVQCYNASSVPLESFASPAEVADIHQSAGSPLANDLLPQLLGRLQSDIDYLRAEKIPDEGIAIIKREHGIETFDLVLIDGSEFTGVPELAEVYGAKLILLDDVNTFKNQRNFARLRDDPQYALIAHNPQARNGHAIFRRRDYAPVTWQTVQWPVGAIRGRSLPAHGRSLFDKVRSLPDDAVILELGAGAGRDTAAMAHACIGTGRRIRAARIPSPGAWKSNLERSRLEEYASPAGDASGAGAVDLVVLGGGREEADALRDLREVWPRVKEGGWVAVRDVARAHPGSMRAWRSVAKQVLESAEYTSTLVCAQKPHAAELPEPLLQCGDGPADPLPVHFFTAVLNGEPFIRHHLAQFKNLPFEWHWHIIEGVAEWAHDSASGVAAGGRVPAEFHREGRSTDGTSEYLDRLAREHPRHVTVYRKPRGTSWNGKLEMMNMPLLCLGREALLWQIDADELWTAGQITTARQMFIDQPARSAGFFWAWSYVGPGLVISTRNCYANNPQVEWLRTWRFRPGMRWAAHEPPVLAEPAGNSQWRDVGRVNPFTHAETEARGLVFQHFADVFEERVRFKESYCGHTGGVDAWLRLQAAEKYPVALREYLPWVRDGTEVDRAENYVRTALAAVPPIAPQRLVAKRQPRPRILIDSIFFQYYQTGIARVWRTLLLEWSGTEFAGHLLVLDRAGAAPRLPGLRYRLIADHDYGRTEADRAMLQQVCTEEGADLFISTYYTTPISTPSVFMAYDMIPEALKFDLRHPVWTDKHHAIGHASAFVCISANTATDLMRFFTHIARQTVTVAHCGVDPSFRPAGPAAVRAFRARYGLARPYFLFVGSIDGYKNGMTLAAAMADMPERGSFDILCTGRQAEASIAQFRTIAAVPVHSLHVSDEEMRLAYCGAIALVYPSIYEGFGLPIVEAMACGCPVITSGIGAMAEVAGPAAVFVDPTDASMLAAALRHVLMPENRQLLIAAGLEQARKFSWTEMARIVRDVLMRTAKESGRRGTGVGVRAHRV